MQYVRPTKNLLVDSFEQVLANIKHKHNGKNCSQVDQVKRFNKLFPGAAQADSSKVKWLKANQGNNGYVYINRNGYSRRHIGSKVNEQPDKPPQSHQRQYNIKALYRRGAVV